MTNIPPGSVCEKCGHGVHANEEGRVVCDGCDQPTPYCECAEKR